MVFRSIEQGDPKLKLGENERGWSKLKLGHNERGRSKLKAGRMREAGPS